MYKAEKISCDLCCCQICLQGLATAWGVIDLRSKSMSKAQPYEWFYEKGLSFCKKRKSVRENTIFLKKVQNTLLHIGGNWSTLNIGEEFSFGT